MQLGSDLNGETDNDEFGYSIDINSDGDTLAVGTKDLSHNTAVYKYDSGSWSLYGNTIKNNVSSGNIFTTEGTTPNYGTTISTESGSSGWANLTTSDETILKANNPGTSDQFGYSVAISGDYAIFGAFREDTSNDDSGAAYIFERINGTWTQVQWLKASEAAEDDYFGYSVAISGDYAIVGAYRESTQGSKSGAAYIFERNANGSWGTVVSGQSYYNETQKLKASNAGNGDWFGFSVAISGNYAIVGSTGEDSNADQTNQLGANSSGAAYIFERTGGTWTQVQILKASNAEDLDQFGTSVAISGDYAIVGAPNEDTTSNDDSGAAYIFERNANGNWGTVVSGQSYYNETQILRSSNPGEDDFFGVSVAINGDYAIVGAIWEDSNSSGSGDSVDNAGAAYVFERANGTWDEVKFLKASNAGNGDNFGISVAISGNYAIVGAYWEDSDSSGSGDSVNNAGAAYVFERANGTWTEVKILKASDADENDNFGNSVAISGSYAIVGAKFESTTAASSGAVYIFEAPTTTITNFRLNTLSASTKPKFNKTGDKLTILSEQHFADLSSNGFVQSYEYSTSDVSWNYLGNKIESAAYNDISGGDIAFNNDGDIIAIGYPNATGSGANSGFTKIYKYDSSWNQLGSTINGESAGDYSGTAVEMEASGNIIAIGSYNNTNLTGVTRIYEYDESSWSKLGGDIAGSQTGEYSGWASFIE